MFKAFVIVCHIMNADVCMVASDNRGPYKTEERCKERLREMTTQLREMFKTHRTPFIIKQTACVEPDKTGV